MLESQSLLFVRILKPSTGDIRQIFQIRLVVPKHRAMTPWGAVETSQESHEILEKTHILHFIRLYGEPRSRSRESDNIQAVSRVKKKPGFSFSFLENLAVTQIITFVLRDNILVGGHKRS